MTDLPRIEPNEDQIPDGEWYLKQAKTGSKASDCDIAVMIKMAGTHPVTIAEFFGETHQQDRLPNREYAQLFLASPRLLNAAKRIMAATRSPEGYLRETCMANALNELSASINAATAPL